MIKIEYANGNEAEVENVNAAKEIIEAEYPVAVYGPRENGAYGTERILVWENEEIAGEPGIGDDGSHAVAAIVEKVA